MFEELLVGRWVLTNDILIHSVKMDGRGLIVEDIQKLGGSLCLRNNRDQGQDVEAHGCETYLGDRIYRIR